MRKYVDIALPGAKVGVQPSTVGLLMQAAFNIDSGGCRHWITGDVRGAHDVSPGEARRRDRLAYAIDIPPCWLLLVLRDSRYHVPYTLGGQAVTGLFGRINLLEGLTQLYVASWVRFQAIINKQVTPELADEVVQLGMFGRVAFTRRKPRSRRTGRRP